MTKLTEITDELKRTHPAHAQAIVHGLNLALLGRVHKPDNAPHYHDIQVGQRTITHSTPKGWHCDCPQGQGFGPPIEGLFVGQPCRHLCKHIVAAAICWLANEYPEKPHNMYEAFLGLIAAGEVPPVGGDVLLNKSLKVRLAHRLHDGRPVLEMRTGYVRSDPMAVWATDVTGPCNRGYWQVLPEAEEAYKTFRIKVQKGIL